MNEALQEDRQPQILFVDDERAILSSLRRMFRSSNYNVHVACSGAEAIELLEKNDIDLVVSDMRMPEMDGAALLSTVAKRWPNTERMLLTGYSEMSSAIEAINQGKISRYLTKPWDDSEIVICVEQALQNKRLVEEKERLERLTVKQNEELLELNESLEEKVALRTREIETAQSEIREQAEKLLESNNSLEHEISERQRFEVELRHAQKLEAVGQMAAGIAHEINTPIQFVGDSLVFLHNAFADLKTVASVSHNCLESLKGDRETHETLQEALENADIEYLVDRVPKALDRAKNGLERVSNIVKAMNEFSHPNQREMSIADLNSAVESTLVVAANEYKYSATLNTELQELPPVHCHIGNINQVLLNLIINATHAIVDQHGSSVSDGMITVKSWVEGEKVVVSVTDNGSGIPEPIQSRIFDPFFTTKEIGKGTGQGLSISHKIVVENHGGQLHFDTEQGVGTTFYVTLPIDSTKRRTEKNEIAA
ncbi:MAG: response regulator [Granulosicoccus sp.]